MTVEEWAALPEDEPGELVDGYLVEEEMPENDHEQVVSWLVHVLRAWIAAKGGFVFGSEAKYRVRASRGRKPDVAVFFPSSRPPPKKGVNRRPPDLAVEVVTPTPRDRRRDRVDKVQDYAAFGIRFYWLLDPESRTLEILELGPDRRYVLALAATRGVVERVPGCPELMLDLDALWAEIDRLGPDEAHDD
jgi:Uma2 family endonuclease